MRKKITARYLEKYVKHLFGITNVRFKIVGRLIRRGHRFSGYCERYTDGSHTLTFERKILERDNFPQWIIWHELGHIVDTIGKGKVESEYNAQMWAILQAKRRGYYKILQVIVGHMDEYWTSGNLKRYHRVRNMILGETR